MNPDWAEIVCTRVGIDQPNAMQRHVATALASHQGAAVLLAPTGAGKTIAAATVMASRLNPDIQQLQAVVLSPQRELALQLTDVLRRAVAPCKITCCYGGHNAADEIRSLQAGTQVLVATPGRLLDLVGRDAVDLSQPTIAVVDEYDKLLTLGFADATHRLLHLMRSRQLTLYTSATRLEDIAGASLPTSTLTLDFLATEQQERDSRLHQWLVNYPSNQLDDTLVHLLLDVHHDKTIVFVNQREAVFPLVKFLWSHGISAGSYHGQMDQQDREITLAMFTAGAIPMLVATDLAARGLDIDSVDTIVHRDLPLTEAILTHRNGRAARVDQHGNVYLLVNDTATLPAFIPSSTPFYHIKDARRAIDTRYRILYIKAGRKEKVSRGDIVGFLVANGNLDASQIGRIAVMDHYAVAAIDAEVNLDELIAQLRPHRLKHQKPLISEWKVRIH